MRKFKAVVSVVFIMLLFAFMTSTASIYCYERLCNAGFNHPVIVAFLVAYFSFMFLVWLGIDKMDRLMRTAGWN